MSISYHAMMRRATPKNRNPLQVIDTCASVHGRLQCPCPLKDSKIHCTSTKNKRIYENIYFSNNNLNKVVFLFCSCIPNEITHGRPMSAISASYQLVSWKDARAIHALQNKDFTLHVSAYHLPLFQQSQS